MTGKRLIDRNYYNTNCENNAINGLAKLCQVLHDEGTSLIHKAIEQREMLAAAQEEKVTKSLKRKKVEQSLTRIVSNPEQIPEPTTNLLSPNPSVQAIDQGVSWPQAAFFQNGTPTDTQEFFYNWLLMQQNNQLITQFFLPLYKGLEIPIPANNSRTLKLQTMHVGIAHYINKTKRLREEVWSMKEGFSYGLNRGQMGNLMRRQQMTDELRYRALYEKQFQLY